MLVHIDRVGLTREIVRLDDLASFSFRSLAVVDIPARSARNFRTSGIFCPLISVPVVSDAVTGARSQATACAFEHTAAGHHNALLAALADFGRLRPLLAFSRIKAVEFETGSASLESAKR